MTTNLLGKSFLSLLDFSADEILFLLQLSHQLKAKRQAGQVGTWLQGKNVALLFEKTSTRTRCAFEIGVIEEGGHASFIDIASSQFGKKESVADSAKVLAGFFHAIEYRGYAQATVSELAQHAQIPVYNGLTDDDHPTQILADLMTIQEYLPTKPLSQVKVAYIGDTRNNMCKAWMYACAQLGMHFVGYGPAELHPEPELIEQIQVIAANNGGQLTFSADDSCLAGIDVVYTDVWISMGEEDQLALRVKLLQAYQVNQDLLAKTNNPNVLFMHCLPAFHDQQTKFVQDVWQQFGLDVREVSDEVFHGPHSVVFPQAANRLHTIKAILVATLSQTFYHEMDVK